MKLDQIAIQLYTLRDFLKTPDDFAQSCRKIAEIGYRAVQVSAVDYQAVPPGEIARICAEYGLTICATHEKGRLILDEPNQVIDRLGELGASLTAYPSPEESYFTTEAAFGEFLSKLNAAGERLLAAGFTLAYHNHHIEFRKLQEKVLLERIFEETSSRFLQGEPDTYWIQYGGGDPIAWCHRLAGRLPIIHLKDYRVNDKNEVTLCEVGNGNLNMPGIIAAAEQAGCQWFCVEQDTCPGDPFESIRFSFEYLSRLVSA